MFKLASNLDWVVEVSSFSKYSNFTFARLNTEYSLFVFYSYNNSFSFKSNTLLPFSDQISLAQNLSYTTHSRSIHAPIFRHRADLAVDSIPKRSPQKSQVAATT